MKIVLTLAVFCTLAGLIVGEGCRSDSDCTHVQCPEQDYERHCVHPLMNMNGMCTCTHVGNSCVSLSDCKQDACPHSHDEHCIDGMCRCGLFAHGGQRPSGGMGGGN